MKNVLNFNRTPMDVGGMKKMKSTVQNTTRWLITLITIFTFGTGQMWAWTFDHPYIYFDNSYSNWDEPNTKYVQFFLQKSDGSQGWNMTKVSGTHLFYLYINDNWSNGNVSYYRIASVSSSSDWGWKDQQDIWTRLYNNSNCYGITGLPGSGNTDPTGYQKSVLYVGASGTYNKTSAVNLASQTGNLSYTDLNYTQTLHFMLSDDDGDTYSDITTSGTWRGDISATHTYMSGNGTSTTSSNQALSSSTYTKSAALSSTFTLTESNTASGYAFRGWALDDDGPDDDDATFSIENVRGTNDIYAYFVVSPSVSISSVTATTPATPLLGEAVTIAASCENVSGTPTIDYQVKKPGDANFSTVASTTETSYDYTPSSSDPIGVYTFRTRMVYSEVEYISGTTETLYVGKMATLKIKDASSWLSNIYLYTSDATPVPLADYPGNTLGTYGSKNGQWWVLSVYSKYNNFIVNETTFNNKSSDMLDWSDGDCYVFNNTWNTTLSSGTCPSAPSLTTTSAPSPLTNTSATLLGNISSNGNDAITDYGFYWGTSDADTKAQIAASDHSGSISKAVSVTAGTTYYYKAYAKNGQGSMVYGTKYSFTAPYKVTVSKSTGCSSISSEGVNYTTSSIDLTAVARDGYTFSEWTVENGETSSAASEGSTNTVTFTPSDDEATITATYTENTHSVTVGKTTGGSTNVTSVSGVGVDTRSGTITATPTNLAWRFKNWTIPAGVTIASGSETSASITINATADSKTITANFEPRYELLGNRSDDSGTEGMPGWTRGSSASFEVISFTGVDTKDGVDLECSRPLLPNRTYKFMVYDRERKTDCGATTSGQTLPSGGNWELNSSDTKYHVLLNTAGYGNYVFHITKMGASSTYYPSIQVDRPTSYKLTLGAKVYYGDATNGTASASYGGTVSAHTNENTTGYDITSGQYFASGSNITFTADVTDGYSLEGWYSDAACTSEYVDNASTIIINDGEKTLTLVGLTADTTVYAKFTENMTSVTIHANYSDRGTIIVAAASHTWGNAVTAGVKTGRSLSVTAATGYYFAGWTKTEGTDYKLGSDAASDYEEDSKTPTLKGKGDGETSGQTLTANFEPLDTVYFRNWNEDSNEPLWSQVYVYFSTYVQDECAKSNTSSDYYTLMTREGTSNIYWAYVPRGTTRNNDVNIAFSNHDFGTNYKFLNYEAVMRGDYKIYYNTFVPQHSSTETKNGTTYYKGYWKNHNKQNGDDAGYYLKRFDGSKYEAAKGDHKFTVGDDDHIVCNLRLDNTTSGYNKYMIAGAAGGVMYITSPAVSYVGPQITSLNYTDIPMQEWKDGSPYFEIIPTSEGDYRLTIDQSGDVMKISVKYPVAVGDYRIRHTYDNDGTKYSYGDIIKGGTTNTTVSMYIKAVDGEDAGADIDGELEIAKCCSISAGGPVWTTGIGVANYDLAHFDKGAGVYVFDVTIVDGNANNEDVTSATPSNIGLYEGEFYIKTDCAPGGWVNYTQNIMDKNTINASDFDHYFCKNVGASTNVKFVIANDYNIAITDSIKADATYLTGGNNENTPEGSCIRFSYNSATNDAKRAYLRYSSNNNFLNIKPTAASKIYYKSEGDYDLYSALDVNSKMGEDDGNFVYMDTVYVVPGGQASIQATFNSQPQTLVAAKTFMGGSGSTRYPIKVVYDFKTNHLTTAWMPASAVSAALSDLEVMYVRNGQETVEQITFSGEGSKITESIVYGAFKFDYDDYCGKVGSWPQQAGQETGYTNKMCMFYFSFPFDVKVSDIFGLGTYGKEWKLQRYDGAERAKKGFFRGDGTTTFWKDLTLSDTLKAYIGYSLLLDNDYFNSNATGMVWEGKTKGSTYLYFPSLGEVSSMLSSSTEVTVPEHPCTLTQSWYDSSLDKTLYHSNTDANWNMLGVPLLSSQTGDFSSKFVTEGISYLYQWDPATNTLNPAATAGAGSLADFTFKPMSAYMVQFHGKVTFSGSVVPASVAARRAKETKNYTIDLEVLDSEDNNINHTYVELREGASDEFVLNEDMYMTTNSKAVNIFTFAGDYDVAANVRSMTDQVVAVGVTVKKAGTYKFSMPYQFNGTVTLVDTYSNTRTNLTLSDYEVYLEKGTDSGRFLLEINIHKVATSLENTDANNTLNDGGTHKFIMNDQMYILKNGVIYDARGNRVQ